MAWHCDIGLSLLRKHNVNSSGFWMSSRASRRKIHHCPGSPSFLALLQFVPWPHFLWEYSHSAPWFLSLCALPSVLYILTLSSWTNSWPGYGPRSLLYGLGFLFSMTKVLSEQGKAQDLQDHKQALFMVLRWIPCWCQARTMEWSFTVSENIFWELSPSLLIPYHS